MQRILAFIFSLVLVFQIGFVYISNNINDDYIQTNQSVNTAEIFCSVPVVNCLAMNNSIIINDGKTSADVLEYKQMNTEKILTGDYISQLLMINKTKLLRDLKKANLTKIVFIVISIVVIITVVIVMLLKIRKNENNKREKK